MVQNREQLPLTSPVQNALFEKFPSNFANKGVTGIKFHMCNN